MRYRKVFIDMESRSSFSPGIFLAVNSSYNTLLLMWSARSACKPCMRWHGLVIHAAAITPLGQPYHEFLLLPI